MSLILIAESAHAVSYRSPHLGNAGEGAAGGVATDRPPGRARHEPRSLSINVVRLRRFRNGDRPARCRSHPAAQDRAPLPRALSKLVRTGHARETGFEGKFRDAPGPAFPRCQFSESAAAEPLDS